MIPYSCGQILKLLKKGIFAIDKIKNVTSVENLESLKSILQREIHPKCRPHPLRLGHGGTLDSSATGVLVVGVGYGCKMLPKFLKGNKKYFVTGCFGIETDTYNETGTITKQLPYDHITKELLENALLQFTGNIMQTPPKYSALKQGGRRLSDLTREGHNVIVKSRPVICNLVKCIEFSSPEFSLNIECGGGFYVRSLVHDLGQVLGTCASVTSIRRLQQGRFYEADALPESEWNAAKILAAIDINTASLNRKRVIDRW